MKKILLCIIILICLPAVALSKELQIIINSKPGGNNYKRTMLYMAGLKNLGYNIKTHTHFDTRVAVKVFKQSDQPTLMVYTSNQSAVYPLSANDDNFALLEMAQPLFVCKSNNFKNKKIYTVGIGKQIPQKKFFELFDSLGYKIKMIPYQNSSAVYKGLLGGDIDFMINSQVRSLNFIENHAGKCIGQTLPTSHIGIPSLSESTNVTELPVIHYTVLIKNINVEEIRKDLKHILNNDSDILSYHSKNKVVTFDLSYKDELETVKNSEKIWKIK